MSGLLKKNTGDKKAHLSLAKSSIDIDYFDELVFAETLRQVTDHVSKLPDDMQQVLHMYFNGGKNHREIAEEINSTEDAVRQKEKSLKVHSR